MEAVTIRKQTPWEIQRSVVFAVFLRELNTRFGRLRLGYFWAILEPLTFMFILTVLRGKLTAAPLAGLDAPVFFASGILGYTMFRNIVTSALAGVESNMGLFNYQRVKPADITLARTLLETTITLATGLLIFPLLGLIGHSVHWNSLLLFMAAFGLLICLGLGFGLMFTIVGPLSPETKKIIPYLIRPLFFISAVFMPTSSVPASLLPYVLWNPLLHANELLRESLFTDYTSTVGEWHYLGMWSLGALLLGLIIYRRYHRLVVTSGAIR